VGLSLICLLVPASPALAVNQAKTWHVESYVGAYVPKPGLSGQLSTQRRSLRSADEVADEILRF
jgi:hypothetical protein